MEEVAGPRGRRAASAAVALAMAGGVALWPAVATAASRNVTVGPGGSNSFSPSQLTIEVGDTVVWRNDEGNHNVQADDGSFSSGAPSAGDWRYEHTFTRTGTFSYVCSVHFQMKGAVTVTAASEATPTPTPTATTPTATPSPSPSPAPRPSPTISASPPTQPTSPPTATPSRTPSATSAPTPSPTRTTSAPATAPAPTSATSAPAVAPTVTTGPPPSEDDATASTPSSDEPTGVSVAPTEASETTEAASAAPSSLPSGATTDLVAVGEPGSGGLGAAGIVALGGGAALLGGAGLWAIRRRG